MAYQTGDSCPSDSSGMMAAMSSTGVSGTLLRIISLSASAVMSSRRCAVRPSFVVVVFASSTCLHCDNGRASNVRCTICPETSSRSSSICLAMRLAAAFAPSVTCTAAARASCSPSCEIRSAFSWSRIRSTSTRLRLTSNAMVRSLSRFRVPLVMRGFRAGKGMRKARTEE